MDNILTKPESLRRGSRRHRYRRNIETYILVWFDEINNYFRISIDKLRCIVNMIEIFRDLDQCVDYMINKVHDEQIFFVVSSQFGELVVSHVHELAQLDFIYILNDVDPDTLIWTNKYRKIKGIYKTFRLLYDQLSQDTRQLEHNLISFSVFNCFPSYPSIITENRINKQDASYMYAQLFNEIITKMTYTNADKQDMIDYCRVQYEGNRYQLDIIDEFERDYNLHSPVWWYTRDGFIHKMLNRALFQQDIDTMYAMRVFIKDLNCQLIQLNDNNRLHDNILTLYRGQKMARNYFEYIKTNPGGLLSFNGFLSTTIDRNVALLFAGTVPTADTNLISVLFQIIVDLTLHTNIPFANIDALSNFSGTEKEYLFSMGTTFRIGEIKSINNDHFWNIHLILTNDIDPQLNSLTQHMRQHYFSGPINSSSLGRLMIHMSHFDKAEQLYQIAIESTSIIDNPRQYAALYNNIALAYKKMDDWNASLIHYQHALETEQKYLPPDDIFLAVTSSNLATFYMQKDQIDLALEYTNRSLKINLNASELNDEYIAINYDCLGSICYAQNNLIEGLKHYEHALEIRVKAFPSTHPHIGTSHNNIGFIYAKQYRYSQALNQFNRCLQIELSSFTMGHHLIGVTLNNIAYTQHALGQYQEALQNSLQAVEISTKALGIQHSITQKHQRNFQMIRQSISSLN